MSKDLGSSQLAPGQGPGRLALAATKQLIEEA